MKSNAVVLLIASSLLMNIGCSEVKNLHEMKDSTEVMKQTTTELDEKTGTMVKTTAHLDETSSSLLVVTNELHASMKDMYALTGEMKVKTSKMVDIGIEAGSLDLRAKILERMRLAESIEKKLLLSAQYYSAFDFQLWSNKDFAETERYFWAEKNAKEFILEAKNLIEANGGFEINPAAKPSDKADLTTLNALSTALHYLGPDQEKLLKETPGLKELNMYEMIIEALTVGKDMNMTEENVRNLDGYVREILYYPQVATEVLQARHNMLIAIALKKSMDGSGVKSETMAALTGWTLNFNKLAPAEVYRIKKFAELAVQTKKDMSRLGITPEYYKKAFGINATKRIINKMLVAPEKYNTKLTNEVIALLKEYNRY